VLASVTCRTLAVDQLPLAASS